jgi:hypothetical protein
VRHLCETNTFMHRKYHGFGIFILSEYPIASRSIPVRVSAGSGFRTDGKQACGLAEHRPGIRVRDENPVSAGFRRQGAKRVLGPRRALWKAGPAQAGRLSRSRADDSSAVRLGKAVQPSGRAVWTRRPGFLAKHSRQSGSGPFAGLRRALRGRRIRRGCWLPSWVPAALGRRPRLFGVVRALRRHRFGGAAGGGYRTGGSIPDRDLRGAPVRSGAKNRSRFRSSWPGGGSERKRGHPDPGFGPFVAGVGSLPDPRVRDGVRAASGGHDGRTAPPARDGWRPGRKRPRRQGLPSGSSPEFRVLGTGVLGRVAHRRRTALPGTRVLWDLTSLPGRLHGPGAASAPEASGSVPLRTRCTGPWSMHPTPLLFIIGSGFRQQDVAVRATPTAPCGFSPSRREPLRRDSPGSGRRGWPGPGRFAL